MDRLRLTGYAAVQLVFAFVLIALAVLWIVGGALLVVWVGLALLAVAVPTTRWVANLHRGLAARTLGQPVPVPYLPLPAHGFFAKARVLAADPMTWRDLAWVLLARSWASWSP